MVWVRRLVLWVLVLCVVVVVCVGGVIVGVVLCVCSFHSFIFTFIISERSLSGCWCVRAFCLCVCCCCVCVVCAFIHSYSLLLSPNVCFVLVGVGVVWIVCFVCSVGVCCVCVCSFIPIHFYYLRMCVLVGVLCVLVVCCVWVCVGWDIDQ